MKKNIPTAKNRMQAHQFKAGLAPKIRCRHKLWIAGIFGLLQLHVQAQRTDAFLENLLRANTDSLFRSVIAQKDSFRLQIIYTRIDRNKNNQPSFTNYYFNVDSNIYFNPASIVKLPLALLSLEKMQTLRQKNVDRHTTMLFDSSHPWQVPLYKDSSAQCGLPSLEHFIKKAFLVSDNDAYNRMYQFNGQQYINERLWEKGYRGVRITRQFMGLSEEQNRYTNQIRFLDRQGNLLYTQPPAFNKDTFKFGKPVKLGRAHLDQHDSLILEPIDFTKANALPLESFQQMLRAALFPASVPAKQRFNLSSDDEQFVLQYLSQYPSETNFPKYDTAKFYDSYVKFYFLKGGHQMPPDIRVFNKVGWAYGFLIDASYIVDFKHKVEFMLTSVIDVNSDGVLNDNKYDYETVGLPFLYQLGQTIYHHELTRKRKYKPVLDHFKIKYEKRNAADTRPVIREVDN